MHKHFRMIAISEHLRNHGFDPDLYRHTRIPYIWQKLRTYYNLDVIDERENFDDDEADDRYKDFSLPKEQFFDAMMQRAIADPSEAASSPPQLDLSPPSSPAKKRKRDIKPRGASVDDTEDGTDAQSPAPKSKRSSRQRARAASQAKSEKQDKKEKQDKTETTEDEGDDDEDSGSSEEEEDSAEESGTPVSRSTRGANKKRPVRGKTSAPAAKGRSRRR